MKKPFLVLFILIILFTGCKYKTNRLIADYEYNINSIKVIDILSVSDFYPFYAKDSISILDSLYKATLRFKTDELQLQWEETNTKWVEANEELKTITNPLMYKIYGKRVGFIKEDVNQIEKIISIYKNSPNKTQLNWFHEQADFYSNNTDVLLGYTFKVAFRGRQGALPTEKIIREYFVNVKRNKIVAEITDQ